MAHDSILGTEEMRDFHNPLQTEEDMAREWVGENCPDLEGIEFDRKVRAVAFEFYLDTLDPLERRRIEEEIAVAEEFDATQYWPQIVPIQ